MAISAADEQRLEVLYQEHSARLGGLREDYFALLYLTRKWGADVREIEHQVAFGNNDYGIDAYHIDRRTGNLYLYQFKWSEAHAQFRSSMERLRDQGLPRIFGQAQGSDRRQSDMLVHLKGELRECKRGIGRVQLAFVFKGDLAAAEASESLALRQEELENRAHLVNQYFEREIEFVVEYVADRPGPPPIDPPPAHAYPVRLRAASTATHDGRVMHVGFARLVDLHRIHQSLGQQFFDRNIRAALSADNAPNRKLRDAFDRIVLKRSEDPSVFAFRHNGVTLAAQRVDVEDGTVTLHGPRLLNGAQTVSSLDRFLAQQASNIALGRARDRLDAIEVLAKVVVDDPASEFVTGVTISNNQQNPVPPWALRAMDRKQVDLADRFREELKIYYSRQEGAFESLSDEAREALGVESPKDLRIRPMAMTFLAVQGDLANMKELPSVFEDQRKYDATFRPTYLQADLRRVVLGYKAGLMLPRLLREVETALPDSHARAVPASRYVLWALLVQALLNHAKVQTWAAEYGTRLTREAAYGDVLRKLTTSRVVPLVKFLLAHPDYAPRVAHGRYDFLRTNDAYRRAMAHADERFGWSKQTF